MNVSELFGRLDHRWWLNRLRYVFAGEDVELVYCEVHPPAVFVDAVRGRLESLDFTVETLSLTERDHSFVKGHRGR